MIGVKSLLLICFADFYAQTGLKNKYQNSLLSARGAY